jgi:hypothetical protein
VARHVFISYSRDDRDYVADLVVCLQAEGLTVWTDQVVRVGTQWVRELERQIIDCAAFVPVMSERSNDANWVDREIDLAEDQKRPIAPLLLSGRPFFRLRHLQYEDVRDRNMPSAEFIAALKAMVEEGRQVPFRGRVSPPHPLRPPGNDPFSIDKKSLVASPGVTSVGAQRDGRRVDRQRWMAPASGIAMFLLFFVGTFLTLRASDLTLGASDGGGGASGPAGVAVGSCVAKSANGTLATADCAGPPGAQVITQIVPAGGFCANPRDIQDFFASATWSSICVRPAG